MSQQQLIALSVDVQELLASKQGEWSPRYAGYLKELIANKETHLLSLKRFRIPSPLYLYTSISKSKGAKSEFDLRFKGQSVASIIISAEDKVIVRPQTANNKKHFGISSGEEFEWKSTEGTKFRKNFKELASGIKTKSDEHALENRLLAEFAKKASADKGLCNIRPVELNKIFFQMPTPLSASGPGDILYANHSGGGIDIMARVKMKTGSVPRLTVFELKDENKESESVNKVIRQAVAYGLFIATLLSSDEGWWSVFGYSKPPQEKIINVATLMPKGTTTGDFERLQIKLKNGYAIELHTLYIDQNGNFSGSLKEDMLPHK